MNTTIEQQHFTTIEVARVFGIKPQTIRRAYCVGGNYLGLRPVKLPNRRLLWPAVEVRRILAEAER